MTFQIQLSDVTNSTTSKDGTGIFDVLTRAVVTHIEAQYDSGRLDGTDYANVYLGSIQSVLSESFRFALSEKQSSEQAALIAQQILSEIKNNEVNGLLDLQKIRLEKETALIIRQESELSLNGISQRLVNTSQIGKVTNETLFIAEQIISETKNNESGGVIDLSKTKLQEDIDLIIAQTSTQFEQVLASQGETNRRNALNSKDVLYREQQTDLVIRQESELSLTGVQDRLFTVQRTASTAASTVDSTAKTAADISLSSAQELKIGSDKIFVDSQNSEVSPNAISQRSVDTSQIAKLGTENTLLGSRNLETLAATTRTDLESTQRILLMGAQTIGFKTDAKQKLMRQLFEGYAVNVTTSGTVSEPPNGSTGTALDNIANDILNDLNSGVNV
jgi:hypothetical protein